PPPPPTWTHCCSRTPSAFSVWTAWGHAPRIAPRASTRVRMKRREWVAVSAAFLVAGISRGSAAQTPAPTTGQPQTAAADTRKTFTAAQLDQLLAPVALYPDPLLAQILMGATYPLEVLEAANWSKSNPNLTGDAALGAVKDKGWEAAVTSLGAFPQVLAMMDSKLDWTQKVGDAMIAQQAD